MVLPQDFKTENDYSVDCKEGFFTAGFLQGGGGWWLDDYDAK
jgi:hypothetical protein